MNIMKSLTMTSLLALSTIGLSACGGGEGEVTSAEPLPNVEAPEGTEWRNVVAKTEENGYVIGNPEAPIKLVEYASLMCGACAAFENEAYSEIIEDYVNTGRVSFEIRNFLIRPQGIPLAILTRCGPDETYPALTEQVFKNQNTIFETMQTADQDRMQTLFNNAAENGYTEIAQGLGLIEFFKALGISEDQANVCLADKSKAQELLDMTEKGVKEYKVEGTPSFFINNVKVEYSGWANLKGKLQEAGAR